METKVNFNELDKTGFISQQENAVNRMFELIQSTNYPNNLRFDSVDELKSEIENGYNPDVHFSFYTNEYEEVSVKIG